MLIEPPVIQLMLSRYKEAGYTHADISLDIDEKIIKCGIEVAKMYLKNPPAFQLTNFVYICLRYAYTVLRNYKFVGAWTEADFTAAEAEWRQWEIATTEVLRKSYLVQCVVALTKLVDIQMNYKTFHLKKPI